VCTYYSYDSGESGGDIVITDCDTGIISVVPYAPNLTGNFCATDAYSTGSVLVNIIAVPCPF
jgi:hypothetical protein